ncbi:phosphatase 2C-like domain-containing protein [Blyttiomyces helicus]|uniref:protein-serine/threonine phosphatase n=1 Tax=Blyttiomyces helicus TaxID=388810 RepID=A0A4P9VUI8_9FUNG|nr:phosphatase 2C-like domain-containing protein [Blyttiomyces helicus]|eukprot:RKO83254.1 phosphatase 2C-like domain-containing protein [Blyttiomyces helicus]
MEDAHTTILRLDGDRHISFFGVYDGHGGAKVAQYSGEKIHKKIMDQPQYVLGDYGAAMTAGFLGTDQDLRIDPEFENDPSGCTAVATIITDDWRIVCANAGDSRAVLSANGVEVPLSFDHKPVNPLETKRITEGGGYVEYGRVNGNLALSRAIGDFEFKNPEVPAESQIVTANPEIIERKLEDTDEFVVIACDGIWDCKTNQEVVTYVRNKVAAGVSLQQTCEDMMEDCLAADSEVGGVGCDNMTVMIIALRRGKTYEEWANEIKERVERTSGTAAVPAAEVTSNGMDE